MVKICSMFLILFGGKLYSAAPPDGWCVVNSSSKNISIQSFDDLSSPTNREDIIPSEEKQERPLDQISTVAPSADLPPAQQSSLEIPSQTYLVSPKKLNRKYPNLRIVLPSQYLQYLEDLEDLQDSESLEDSQDLQDSEDLEISEQIPSAIEFPPPARGLWTKTSGAIISIIYFFDPRGFFHGIIKSTLSYFHFL